MDKHLIETLVSRVFPSAPTRVERVMEGVSTYVYRIAYRNEVFYLRIRLSSEVGAARLLPITQRIGRFLPKGWPHIAERSEELVDRHDRHRGYVFLPRFNVAGLGKSPWRMAPPHHFIQKRPQVASLEQEMWTFANPCGIVA